MALWQAAVWAMRAGGGGGQVASGAKRHGMSAGGGQPRGVGGQERRGELDDRKIRSAGRAESAVRLKAKAMRYHHHWKARYCIVLHTTLR